MIRALYRHMAWADRQMLDAVGAHAAELAYIDGIGARCGVGLLACPAERQLGRVAERKDPG